MSVDGFALWFEYEMSFGLLQDKSLTDFNIDMLDCASKCDNKRYIYRIDDI